MLLDGVIATKNAGGFVVGKGIELEKAVEQRLYNTIETTRHVAKVRCRLALRYADVSF